MRRKVRKLRDRLGRHLNVERAWETAATDDSEGAAQACELDRLVADGLAAPALVAKRPRIAPLITGEGAVSDLVTDQRR